MNERLVLALRILLYALWLAALVLAFACSQPPKPIGYCADKCPDPSAKYWEQCMQRCVRKLCNPYPAWELRPTLRSKQPKVDIECLLASGDKCEG